MSQGGGSLILLLRDIDGCHTWLGCVGSYSSYVFLLQAYVGVAKDLNAIVIAFRGTQAQRFGILAVFLLIIYICQLVHMDEISVLLQGNY